MVGCRADVKIIDAIWEQRNLGVTCVEVAVEPGDSVAALRDALTTRTVQYAVVKLPAGRVDAMFALTELGFTFIEGLINVTWKLGPIELPKLQQRLDDGVGYALMDNDDQDQLWRELRSGIHDTDRVAIDPRFSKEKAGERYVGWIQDELARGTDVFKMTLKGNAVGYFTMKHLGDGVYYPFLGGMYQSHRNSGLGFLVAHKPKHELVKRNGKQISTYISTNNEPTIRMHVAHGFHFGQVTYVYVKHS